MFRTCAAKDTSRALRQFVSYAPAHSQWKALGLPSGRTANAPIDIHPEVQDALATNKPVVALESTIISHGMTYPTSLETALSVEEIVRSTGSIPATIGLIGGRVKIGLSRGDIEHIANTPSVVKISRRDIAPAIALRKDGGTTCSATLIFAALAGIKVFATGGTLRYITTRLGGVHRGGENTMDVSADLHELTRCPVGLVSAGVKSILDIGRTLEYLETLGVPVLSYAETYDFPAFYTAQSGHQTPWRVNDPTTAATILYTQSQLGMTNGALFAVPIPEEYEAVGAAIQDAVERAVSEAEEQGMRLRGKEVTPWLLKRVSELTQGRSLASNVALIQNTALVGGNIAVEYAKLIQNGSEPTVVQLSSFFPLDVVPHKRVKQAHYPVSDVLHSRTETQSPSGGIPELPLVGHSSQLHTWQWNQQPLHQPSPSLVVIGSAAVDITSRPHITPASDTDLAVHSTSPGSVAISLGGVGRNIAEAAHRVLTAASPTLSAATLLLTAIGQDSFGRLMIDDSRAIGMRIDGLTQMEGGRSSVCNLMLDVKGSLIIGIADMDILQSLDGIMAVECIEKYKPKIVAVDGNLSAETLTAVVGYCARNNIDVLFEPTSKIKSTVILPALAVSINTTGRKQSPVTFASPNLLELAHIYQTAVSMPFDLMANDRWWQTIDRFGLNSEFRMSLDQLARRAVSDVDPSLGDLSFLTTKGILQMAINLLPFFQHLIIKCGELGVVLVMRLQPSSPDCPWLSERSNPHGRYILSQFQPSSDMLVVQHFPPLQVGKGTLVNDTGAGDSLVGSILAGLVQNPAVFQDPRTMKDAINNAQRAAVLTLQSEHAVSPILSSPLADY